MHHPAAGQGQGPSSGPEGRKPGKSHRCTTELSSPKRGLISCVDLISDFMPMGTAPDHAVP